LVDATGPVVRVAAAEPVAAAAPAARPLQAVELERAAELEPCRQVAQAVQAVAAHPEHRSNGWHRHGCLMTCLCASPTGVTLQASNFSDNLYYVKLDFKLSWSDRLFPTIPLA
jgi:hypothetical protein